MQETSRPAKDDTPWDQVVAELRKRVRPEQYETWFANLSPSVLTHREVKILVPNSFYRDWLERKYLDTIRTAFQAALAWQPEISFAIDQSVSPKRNNGLGAEAPHQVQQIQLNAQYTFENFIVGQCNRLAHAAALAVAEAPGTAYNPLFIHGGVGLGKTHLLQAICHVLLGKDPNVCVLYLSCETFMNQFISAIQHGSLEAFRAQYRNADVIMIDDVHFLARGESTQEEFFHTFNTLYNAQKQIILSSDSPPEDIPTLEERLVSRFKWGLVSRLDTPDFETRVAIVQNKAKLRGNDLPDEVVHFIATHVDTNIRELEGAIIKTLGFASLAEREIDMKLAHEALEDVLPNAKPITIEEIQNMVTKRYHVKLSDLQSKKKSKSIAFPRQICMYLARALTPHSLEEIGGYFGGRDHTTVMYADDKIRHLAEQDGELRTTLQDIETELRKKAATAT